MALFERRRWVFVFVCTLLVSHGQGQTNSEDKDSTNRTTAAAVKSLRQYVELRLHNADWVEYSKFVTWPDEPGWDCNWVVRSYFLKSPEERREKVIIPVVYKRLGLFCYDFNFTAQRNTVRVDYELVKHSDTWKVNAPIPDYPDISDRVMVRSLEMKARSGGESTDRRAKFEAAARQIEESSAQKQ